MTKKVILYSTIAFLIVLSIIGFNFYQKIYANNTTKDGFVFVETNTTIEQLSSNLSPFIKDKNNFVWVSEKKRFTKPKAGKYKITQGMSNNQLVNLFRSGNQIPVKVSFNNIDSLEKLAGSIAKQIEADSISLLKAFKENDFLEQNGFTQNSALGMYIPNSYELYWNANAQKFRNRMLLEYKAFWNTKRLAKAKALNMTPKQVMVLASIVQKETAKTVERPIVAGLYINRLRKGIPLQSDPTIVFILKQQNGQDFVVKRVLRKDLSIQSPYNTYLNRGLPPTLIAMPDISSVDAVLNYKKHNYYYMCASAEKIGYHEFASTLQQHNRNAAKYQRWLNQQRIFR